MLERSTVLVTALLLLAVPTLPALADDGINTVPLGPASVTNDEQHENRIELTVDGNATEVGRWLDPIDKNASVPAVNLAVLPGGKILFYSGVEADESKNDTTDLHFMWNATPLDGQSRVMTIDGINGTQVNATISLPTPVEGGPVDIFCSGTTIMPDGNSVSPGATEYYTMDENEGGPVFDPSGPTVGMKWANSTRSPLQGWEQAVVFNASNDTWSQTDPMTVPRWYPSAIQLPDGDTMVASGIRDLFWPQTYNTLVERYDPDGPASAEDWRDVETSFEVADGVSVPQDVLRPFTGDPTDASNNSKTNVSDTGLHWADETHQGVPNIPMYPRLRVVPDGPHEGEVLYGANGDVWGPFGHHPLQEIFGHFQTLNFTKDDELEANWTIHASSPFSVRNLGATVPLLEDATDGDAEARYLSFGGTLQQSLSATATAEIIDASQETVTSTPTEPMVFPRWSVNGVLLPDGSVLSIGGSVYDNVLMHGSPTAGPTNLERFVPNDDLTGGTWETLPGMEDVRAYHSTAVLLPDGRVLVGGHVPLPAFHHHQRTTLGNPQPTDETFEIYEPAYLHHDGETQPKILTTLFGNVPQPDATVGSVNGTPKLVADYGDNVTVPVDDLENPLDSVVLMRPGATTHQFNADQLGIEVDAEKATAPGGQPVVNVTIPDDVSFAPGHYMLFVNEDVSDGIFPSESLWISIGDDATS